MSPWNGRRGLALPLGPGLRYPDQVSASEAQRVIHSIFRSESARLIARLTHMLRDVGLAEELAQDSLVAALEHWPDAGVPDKPAAWLMATAKRCAIDELRRNKRVERGREELGQALRDGPTSTRRWTTTSETTC